VEEVALAGEDHGDAPSISGMAITSASRIEPPGWMIAVTPASRRRLDAVREGEERV
jgi:hypothetical protein